MALSLFRISANFKIRMARFFLSKIAALQYENSTSLFYGLFVKFAWRKLSLQQENKVFKFLVLSATSAKALLIFH